MRLAVVESAESAPHRAGVAPVNACGGWRFTSARLPPRKDSSPLAGEPVPVRATAARSVPGPKTAHVTCSDGVLGAAAAHHKPAVVGQLDRDALDRRASGLIRVHLLAAGDRR